MKFPLIFLCLALLGTSVAVNGFVRRKGSAGGSVQKSCGPGTNTVCPPIAVASLGNGMGAIAGGEEGSSLAGLTIKQFDSPVEVEGSEKAIEAAVPKEAEVLDEEASGARANPSVRRRRLRRLRQIRRKRVQRARRNRKIRKNRNLRKAHQRRKLQKRRKNSKIRKARRNRKMRKNKKIRRNSKIKRNRTVRRNHNRRVMARLAKRRRNSV